MSDTCQKCYRLKWRSPINQPVEDAINAWRAMADEYRKRGEGDAALECQWHIGELEHLQENGLCRHSVEAENEAKQNEA